MRYGLSALIATFLLLFSGSMTTALAQPVDPEGLKADLRLAVETIEQLHPNLAHSVDRTALARTVREAEAAFDRPMNRDEAWAVLARLNPVLADGHLLIGFPDWRDESRQALASGGAFFPFEVSVADSGDLMIVAELGGAQTPLAGRLVRRINGLDARLVVRELLARTHGDTPRMRTALLSQRWWFLYRKLYSAPASFDLALAGGTPLRTRVAASRAVPDVLRREAEFDRLFRLELLPGDAALLTIDAFYWPDKDRFFAFTRSVFARMREAGTRTLVIDIRANGGGDDDMWRDGILRYVADRPYRTGSRYIKRVLEAYRDEDEVTGQIVRGEIETLVEPAYDEPLRFDGDVHVLIGPLTYSSAVLFSNVVQDYRFGTLVGTGDAVRAQQSGSVQALTLPNTGLVLSYPRFILDRPSGLTDPSLLQPDIEIEDDPFHPQATVEALLRAGPA